MDEYIGMIKIFAGNFAPKNWAFCQGQTMQISTNQALFAILGTMYGGDGVATFKLPNLQGMTPIGMGTSPITGTTYVEAQVGGNPSVALRADNLPPHTHALTGSVVLQANSATTGEGTDPTGSYPGITAANAYATTGDTPMGALASTLGLGATGGSTPIDKHMPSLAVNYIVCLYGLFPTRN